MKDENATLAILGVAAAVVMSALYGENAFEYRDVLPGLMLVAIVAACWHAVSFRFYPSIAISIMMGGGLMTMTGFLVEPIVVGDHRSDLLAGIWGIWSLVVYCFRYTIGPRGSHG